jgi:hypothetical protein
MIKSPKAIWDFYFLITSPLQISPMATFSVSI